MIFRTRQAAASLKLSALISPQLYRISKPWHEVIQKQGFDITDSISSDCPTHQTMTPEVKNSVTLLSVKNTLKERSAAHGKYNKNQERVSSKV